MGRATNSSMTTRIEHRSHRLADGREVVLFSDRGTPPVEHLVDTRPQDERSGHGQLRFDRLTGEWIAVAAHRQSRTYLPPADQCPLCPSVDGRQSEIPVEDLHVVAFENRFPSLDPGLGELPATEGEADPELGALRNPRTAAVRCSSSRRNTQAPSGTCPSSGRARSWRRGPNAPTRCPR